MDTISLKKLLENSETRHETLSVLCELAGLSDKGLLGACADLAKAETTDRLTQAVLWALARRDRERSEQGQEIKLEDALSFVRQLETLLHDMELHLSPRLDLSEPERLRRKGLIEGGRWWAREALEGRDERALAILAEGSRRLGELVLTSSEGWRDEGVGLLLGALSGLAGAVRVDVERLKVEEVVEASRYPALLGALWRGVEAREERWGDELCRRRLEGSVSAESLELAVGVARRVALSERRRVAGVDFEMVWCPAGEFWMGSDEEAPDDERPRHRVKVSQPFLMGQTQVTQELWEAVMGSNPSDFFGDQNPVEQVSWYDMARFCNALSALENFKPAYKIEMGDEPTVHLDFSANGYRMPTEAEWEYAAKAGSELEPAESDDFEAMPWCYYNSGQSTHPVGEKQANEWGLYDMTGNVSEWCSDKYEENAYSYRAALSIDPCEYTSSPTKQVSRGGNWYNVVYRITSRDKYEADTRQDILGGRLLRRNLDT